MKRKVYHKVYIYIYSYTYLDYVPLLDEEKSISQGINV
jgi:hypothetical protein